MIESYIGSCSFKTKEDWVDCIRSEYGHAVTTPIFPRAFTIAYAKVMREISKELTLADILQIKKIIGDADAR